jgi:hypothetical protein
LIANRSGEYDIIVFMARKAVCLAEALRLLRMTSFQCTATSQRVLDMDPTWIKGKKIAIFDDALITGTTVAKLVLYLQGLDCDVDVFTLCINNKWDAQIVKPKHNLLYLDDGQCASICAKIVDAISLVPIPYATDYPYFSQMHLSTDQLQCLIASPYWKIRDNSTYLQKTNNLLSYTLEPSDYIQKRIIDSIGPKIGPNSLVKIRLYARPFTGNSSMNWCCILPIVAFDPMSFKELDERFREIMTNHPEFTDFSDSFDERGLSEIEIEKRKKAKLRFIQNYCSLNLANEFLSTLVQVSNFMPTFELSLQSLSYLLPESISSVLVTLYSSQAWDTSLHPSLWARKNQLIERKWSSGVYCYPSLDTVTTPSPKLEQKAQSNKDNIISVDISDINDRISWSEEQKLNESFVSIYLTEELKARQIARDLNGALFQKNDFHPKYKEIMDRLERGHSLTDLRNKVNLHGELSKQETFFKISEYLDRMIDRGVVVPTTCVTNGHIYRAYRHGEDVMFGESEQLALQTMLHAYVDSFTSTYNDLLNLSDKTKGKIKVRSLSNEPSHISGLNIEKLSVITIRNLLKHGHFNAPPRNSVANFSTIGIRYNIFGAVVVENERRVYVSGKAETIRNILADSGYISTVIDGLDEGSTYYEIHNIDENRQPQLSNHSDVLNAADKIGYIFGLLRGHARGTYYSKTISTDDLTLLATIARPKDICGALAGTMNIIHTYLLRYHRRMMKPLISNTTDINDINFLRNRSKLRIPNSRNNLFTALHSAHWKYNNWNNERLKKVVTKVSQALHANDKSAMYIWNEIWPSIGSMSNVIADKKIKKHINALAVWHYKMMLHYSAFVLSVLHIDSVMNLKLPKKEYYTKSLKDYKISLNALRTLHVRKDIEEPDELLRRLSESGEMAIEIAQGYFNKMMSMQIFTKDLLNKSTYYSMEYGKRKTYIEYKHCLMIHCEGSLQLKEKVHSNILYCLNGQIGLTKSKKKDNISSIVIVPPEFHRANDSIIIAGYNRQDLTALVKLVCECATSDYRFNLRYLLLPNLGVGYRLGRPAEDNRYHGSTLSSVMNCCINNLMENSKVEPGEIVIATHKKIDANIKKMDNDTRQLYSSNFALRKKGEINDEINSSLQFDYFIFQPKENADMFNSEYDLGIIAPDTNEYAAVCKYLEKFPDYEEEIKIPIENRWVTLGQLPSKNGGFHKVVCIMPQEQGQDPIHSAYSILHRKFQT